jgi:hypothetical protein
MARSVQWQRTIRVFRGSDFERRLRHSLYSLRHLFCFSYPCQARCGPGKLSGYSDWLRAGRSVDRIQVGARFSAPVQTGPGAHPASCTMATGSFPGGKERPGRDVGPSAHSGLYAPYIASVLVQGCTLQGKVKPPLGLTAFLQIHPT